MKLAIIPVLLGVLSGTAYAGEISAHAPAPKGYVTVQELPLVVVEAKRWTAADEQALAQAQAQPVERNLIRRVLAYAAR